MEQFLFLTIIILLLFVIAEVYFLSRPKKTFQTKPISMLIDTSALMDGRVLDIAKTGFLLGQVIIPRSVLSELQFLADGSDHAKRERARHGMDVVRELQTELGSSFKLLQDGARASEGVDERLIALAKSTDSAILTLDYNLNKVATVEGIKVLNVNELAKSLRMVHLPGDSLRIELVQKGQAADQAVGYLNDGTMVVVEQAKKFLGETHEVEIIRSLQTDAGKMMFAKMTGPVSSSYQPKGPKSNTGGRKPSQKPQPAAAPARRARPVTKRPARPSGRVDHEAELIRLAEKHS